MLWGRLHRPKHHHEFIKGDRTVIDQEPSRATQTRRVAQQHDDELYIELPSASKGRQAVLDTMLSSTALTVHEQYEGHERRFAVPLDHQAVKLGRTAQGGPHGPNDLVLEVPFAARDQARIEPDGLGHRLVHLGAPN